MKNSKCHLQTSYSHLAATACLCLLLSGQIHAGKTDQIIETGEQRIEEGRAAQQTIDNLNDKTIDITAEYKQTIKVVEGLKIYNDLLQKQIDAQNRAMSELKTSIAEVSLIERQIVPLMVKMIDSLDEFIQLDIPFTLDERNERVAKLRALLERSDVTVAEKFRRVLEAYQIEIDYGKTLKAYRGTLNTGSTEKDVEFLRVGRIALLYQTLDGSETGAWNNTTKSWESLDGPQYRIATTKALRIAKKQIAPDLIILPVAGPEASE